MKIPLSPDGFATFTGDALERFRQAESSCKLHILNFFNKISLRGAGLPPTFVVQTQTHGTMESAPNSEMVPLWLINRRFNEQLEKQEAGLLEQGHVYDLGYPQAVLLSTGIPKLPIRLSAKTLNIKSHDKQHGYALQEIRGLVLSLQRPWAIFKYGDAGKAQNMIVDLSFKGKQFLVGISLCPTVNGRVLKINSVRNVFPKDNHEWINWINQGKLLRVDEPKKIQAIIDKLRINPVAFGYVDLDSATKIIQNFENPAIP